VSKPHTPSSKFIGVVLLSLAALVTLLAAAIAATGGFTLTPGGFELSMHAVARPVVAALALGSLGVWALIRHGRTDINRMQVIAPRDAAFLAAVFAILIGSAVYAGSAHIAGGADSSGYLSEARLWRAAGPFNLSALRTTTPIAREITPINRQYVFTPIGYQPAGPAAIVPGYPPGLPIQFAIASAIGGEAAERAVVPFALAGLVIVAFLFGYHIGGPAAALLSAAATGSSPMLLYQATQPMSDVVAAFWWLLGTLLALRTSTITLIGSGVALAIACAVRPNLFALAPVLLLLAWWWRGWSRRAIIPLAACAAPIILGAAAFAFLQSYLYGSASTTGYGEVGTLFSIANIFPNLASYPRWAIHTQSALLILALGAPLAVRRQWVTPAIDRTIAERVCWSAIVLFACLQAFYLLYIPFDDWVYFRFLLPALPAVLALQSVVIASVIGRIRMAKPGFVLVLVAVLMASWGVGRARSLGAFRLQESEQRYLDVAGFVRGLPPDAVFVTVQHSGSLAYYNHSAVLRWDWLEAREIDAVIAELTDNGHTVYLVLDDWEEATFRARFTGTNIIQRLDAPVFAAGGPPGITAKVFAARAAPAVGAGG
jgi:hypothetical protein